MNLANCYSYPQAVVKAVENQLYLPNEDIIRVSELIDSPLIKRLLIKYWDKITVDVDEIVYTSLFGTAWHQFLSGFEVNALIEKRWSVNIKDIILTGQTDIYKSDKGIIEDNKTQSAWSFVFDQPRWRRQLNCYAYLIKQNGYLVNELWINSFLRDWSKYQVMKSRQKNYPKHKFHRIQIPQWSDTEQQKYINERLDLHLNCKDYICTTYAQAGEDNDRWEKPVTWAVKKKSRQDAVGGRVFEREKEAIDFFDTKKDKGKWEIEFRKGYCKKCSDWCIVRSVCKYRGA